MALLKKKIILLNKTKIQQNPQHIELVNCPFQGAQLELINYYINLNFLNFSLA